MTPALNKPDAWAAFLDAKQIPVMRQTARALADARTRMENVGTRDVAAVVLHDPLMTLRVMHFSASHGGKRRLQEINTVEHAVMMLGVEPFFHHFSRFDAVEDLLKPQPQALLGLLHVMRRAQRAARYAADWATWRCDLNTEEVAVAALLHDYAEMLLWCFAPQQALKIQALQKADPSLDSKYAQKEVLGFTLHALQSALGRSWGLSELILNVTNEAQTERPRVRNVKLAIDLARHSADGWDHHALPEDFRAIAGLMNIDESTLMLRLGLKPRER